MSDPMLAAALGYATAGWPVFPCVTPAKVPLTQHGFEDATTDPDQIRAWWSRWPRANLAVATGAPGPDVLDVDTKDARIGMELFDRARRAGLLRGASAIIRTPSGGLHLWFEGTDQPGGAVGPKRALELKARGGYVLLPPSYVDNPKLGYTGSYELTERRDSAGTIDFAAVRRLLAPPQVRRITHLRAGRGTSVDGLIAWLESRPAGDRNGPLYWACLRALESGADRRVLDDLRDAIIRAGHDPHDAERTVESARARYGAVAA